MYNKKSNGWRKHADFIFLDLLCIELSFLVAYWIRHGFVNPYASPVYRNAAIILVFLHILIVFFGQTYKSILRRGLYREFVSVVKHMVSLVLLLAFCMYIIGEVEVFSRATMLVMGALVIVLSYGVRLLWKHHLNTKNDSGKRAILLVTTENWVKRMLRTIANNNFEKLRIIGIVILDTDLQGQTILNTPVVAAKNNVLDYIRTNWVDEVMLHVPKYLEHSREVETLIYSCSEMGVTIHQTLGNLEGLYNRQQFVERIAGFEVLTSTPRLVSTSQLFIKRTMDILGGIVGCIVTAVLYLFIAPCIYIKSPGPIFFSQIRVGRNGKPFKIYKFRSMYLDAEERKKELMEQNEIQDEKMFKIKDDPRIIKGIGHFIRKYSLDEFPQFFNVLKGDMSLVGTRPPTTDEWEKYDMHHRKRLAIKPGLTGLWQVSGRSNIKNFEEVVALDTRYINEWDFGMDLRILLKTVLVVLKNEGAV